MSGVLDYVSPEYVLWLRTPSPKLLDSLLSAKVTRIVPRVRYSRSGLTCYVAGFEVELETNRHHHRLICHVVLDDVYRIVCSWYCDGEEIEVLVFSTDNSLMREILNIIETAVRLEKANGEIVLNFRPKLVIKPSIVIHH